MSDLPFDIPKSLASYVDHFESDPVNATTRLKKQLKKRGPDAVGHFLLSWFYHLKGLDEKAVQEALKAKTLAPGSPFFEKLHYYLCHPQLFKAWKPVEASAAPVTATSFGGASGPVLEDLDTLIQKLSEVEPVKLSLTSKQNTDSKSTLDKDSENTDDIVSETLASIHQNQGKTAAAIKTYKRLQMLNKEKKGYYEEQISKLKKLDKEKDEEE